MRRTGTLALVLLLVSSACIFGGDEEAEEVAVARRLAALASGADDLAYTATYRYALSGPTAEGISFELRIVQDPPTSLRMVESTTRTAEGDEVSQRQWIAQTEEGSFACSRYEVGVRCVPTERPVGLFDLVQVDEVFEMARERGFDEVSEGRTVRVAGERGECFRAVPEGGTPPPERTPRARFTPSRFVFELCYTQDGVLLRALRQITGGFDEEREEGEAPEDLQEEDRLRSLLEATEVSRSVAPEEVELPGPVVEDPSELGAP